MSHHLSGTWPTVVASGLNYPHFMLFICTTIARSERLEAREGRFFRDGRLMLSEVYGNPI